MPPRAAAAEECINRLHSHRMLPPQGARGVHTWRVGSTLPLKAGIRLYLPSPYARTHDRSRRQSRQDAIPLHQTGERRAPSASVSRARKTSRSIERLQLSYT
jgi:hypothetical protein